MRFRTPTRSPPAARSLDLPHGDLSGRRCVACHHVETYSVHVDSPRGVSGDLVPRFIRYLGQVGNRITGAGTVPQEPPSTINSWSSTSQSIQIGNPSTWAWTIRSEPSGRTLITSPSTQSQNQTRPARQRGDSPKATSSTIGSNSAGMSRHYRGGTSTGVAAGNLLRPSPSSGRSLVFAAVGGTTQEATKILRMVVNDHANSTLPIHSTIIAVAGTPVRVLRA